MISIALFFWLPLCTGLASKFRSQVIQLAPEQASSSFSQDDDIHVFQQKYFEKLALEMKAEREAAAQEKAFVETQAKVQVRLETSALGVLDEPYPPEFLLSLQDPGTQDDMNLMEAYYFEPRDPLHRYFGNKVPGLKPQEWLDYNAARPKESDKMTYSQWLIAPPQDQIALGERVAYYTAQELPQYLVSLHPDTVTTPGSGVAIQLGGIPVQGSMPAGETTKEFIFVAFLAGVRANDFVVYGSSKQTTAPRRHHSSFHSGRSVFLAGSGKVVDGRLTAVNPWSGHYQPEFDDFRKRICFVLRSVGHTRGSCAAIMIEDGSTPDNRYGGNSCFCWTEADLFSKPKCTAIKIRNDCLGEGCYWCSGNKFRANCRWHNKPSKCDGPEIW